MPASHAGRLHQVPSADVYQPEPELISRFTIVILACMLLGMGMGCRMPAQYGVYVTVAGLLGIFYYFVCLFRGHIARAQHVVAMRIQAERRLDSQLHESGILPHVTTKAEVQNLPTEMAPRDSHIWE